MILLQHPEHGMKFAHLEAEALADEQNGWVRIDAPAVPEEQTRFDAEPQPAPPLKRKPGRPRKVH